ncbi:MAG: class I SAM-dependent methyltransferase [Gammaproteobacteria bacterium]
MNPAYVHYGCGWTAPPQWRNFDASPTLRFERIPVLGRLYTRNEKRFPNNAEPGDIVRGLPVPDASCQGVYCSHILEHLALEDCRTALRNTLRMLSPGGCFRLVVPDLEHAIRDYCANPGPDAALRFQRATLLGRERRERGPRALLRDWLGNSNHLWMWDEAAMRRELEQAGFTAIRRAHRGDNADPMFVHVEDPGRWEDALGMEARRPS